MGYDGTLKFDTKVDSSGFESGVSKIGSLASGAMKATTAIIGGAATAIVGLGTAAVKVGSDFEASMSNVAAISGATGDELDALTAKAQEMGAKTKFSASESADAFSYMAMAGWKTEDMLNGIEGIMNLAAASGEDLATTSDIVTDALTAFGLSAQDSGHFADVLAAASSNANTNVSLMGETFKYVAPVAGSLGFSAEDTAQAIGLMANAGIKGSQAGTALRSMFTRLAKPTKEVQTAMDALNISLTDEQGNVKDLSTLMGDLREGFANCTDAEAAQYAAMIAGQEGMSGLLAIVNASEDDYNKLADAIAGSTDELTGYSAAEEMAAKQIDNLQGQVTILKSALEGFGIKIYQEMDSPLKDVVKTAQDMVQQLTDAFDEGGFEGLVSAVGDVLSQVLTKIADAAPQFIEMAVSLVNSFCEGLKNAPGIGESGAKLVTSLVQGIMSVMGDLATTAIYLITELVLGLEGKLPDILQTGIDVVLNIIDGITKAMPELIPAAVRIIGSLAQKIVENLPAIIDAAIEIIMALIDGLTEAMPELLDAAVKVFSALVQALPVILDKLLDALPDIITGIINFLVENIPAILDAAIQLFMALVQAIPQIITVLLEHLPEIIEAIVTGLIEGLPQIISAIGEAAITIATMLPELLLSIFTALGEWLAGLLEPVGQFFADAWTAISEWFTELPGRLATFFEGLISDIGEFFSNVISDAGTFLSNLMTDIGEFLTDLPYKIGYALGVAIGKIIQWGKDVFNWIKENVPKMIENIVTFFSELPGKVWEWLKETYNKVVQWGKDTLQNAKQAAKNTIDAVVNFFKELPGKVWQWLSNTVQKVVSFGTDLVNKGKTAATNFFNGFLNIVKNIPNEMFNIGKNIVNGVWNGIQSLASTLWNNVTNFFSGIVNGVKKTLGIASPSRVFADEVGAWIPPGVGEGIENAMPGLMKDTRKQMLQLAEEMQATVDAETGDISFDKTGQQDYEAAQAERRSQSNVNVYGQIEGDRPIEVHTNLYLDKRKFAEEITPAVNHEMYKIDSSENNRGRGN